MSNAKLYFFKPPVYFGTKVHEKINQKLIDLHELNLTLKYVW